MTDYALPIDIVSNFAVGMDKDVKPFLEAPDGLVLNLGAGYKNIIGTHPLDAATGWRAPILPQDDESVSGIYAYHFMEHLAKDDAIKMLQEAQRVLITGGIFNIVVPHWDSEIAHHDLDHKSFWAEGTWRNLFQNPYYDGTMPRDWKLEERQTLIMGLVQRNIVLVTQLVKGA